MLCIEETKEAVEIYPVVPRPSTVDVRESVVSPLEIYPRDPRPCKEDVREGVLIYPVVPRPATVETRPGIVTIGFESRKSVLVLLNHNDPGVKV